MAPSSWNITLSWTTVAGNIIRACDDDQKGLACGMGPAETCTLWRKTHHRSFPALWGWNSALDWTYRFLHKPYAASSGWKVLKLQSMDLCPWCPFAAQKHLAICFCKQLPPQASPWLVVAPFSLACMFLQGHPQLDSGRTNNFDKNSQVWFGDPKIHLRKSNWWGGGQTLVWLFKPCHAPTRIKALPLGTRACLTPRFPSRLCKGPWNTTRMGKLLWQQGFSGVRFPSQPLAEPKQVTASLYFLPRSWRGLQTQPLNLRNSLRRGGHCHFLVGSSLNFDFYLLVQKENICTQDPGPTE